MAEGLRELADRCERASGPDRELDCLIYEALGYDVTRSHGRMRQAKRGLGPLKHEDGDHWSYLNTLTRSLDDAIKLVPEDYGWALETRDGRLDSSVWQPGANGIEWNTRAATPALALCAAALRARAHIQEQP